MKRRSIRALADMMSGRSPYDGADLIAISHEHLDHVSPAVVQKQLEHDPKVQVLCNTVTGRMIANGLTGENLKARVRSVAPGALETKTTTVNGIDVDILRFRHALQQFKNIGAKDFRERRFLSLSLLFPILLESSRPGETGRPHRSRNTRSCR